MPGIRIWGPLRKHRIEQTSADGGKKRKKKSAKGTAVNRQSSGAGPPGSQSKSLTDPEELSRARCGTRGPVGTQEVSARLRGRQAAPRARRSRREGAEAKAQKRFVSWARENGLEITHQNNGARTARERIRLHAMGCTAGAADILVLNRLPSDPEARGLALEFKAPNGRQSPQQVSWSKRIRAHGWRYHVVWNLQEAIELVESYGLILLKRRQKRIP